MLTTIATHRSTEYNTSEEHIADENHKATAQMHNIHSKRETKYTSFSFWAHLTLRAVLAPVPANNCGTKTVSHVFVATYMMSNHSKQWNE